MPSHAQQAQDILDHELFREETKKGPVVTTFAKQVSGDAEFDDFPHRQTQAVVVALQAIAAKAETQPDKTMLEQHGLSVLAAYRQKFEKIRGESKERSKGKTPEGLPQISDRQEVESGGQVGLFSVAIKKVGELEQKLRSMARDMGLHLVEARDRPR